ncbi:tyrosine protein phosphatase [Priestia megaterium]|uniref:CpsB/CapC family capsule biosynthesis tyrosine phosphatase n=1 Tax=Priestia megaterium TaxID=1404 RepID=UPI0021BE8464|nr:CpsB/CapC family capsule biosynthesis tyrosine phosphatase [Priestia megaterium]MCT9857025.1 tyrosine protein phosphatase [Priestia megaterium]MDF1961835.1 tyrosine protein phosphatase [Priestia megaterium]
MIDIHTFVLPNFSKGPKDKDTFIHIAKMLANQGVTHAVATPTINNEVPVESKEAILNQINIANRHLKELSIPLKILLGQKLRSSKQILSLYTESLPINNTNKYLMMDLTEEGSITQFEDIIYKIQLNEVVPIISEPEMCSLILDNPQKLYQFVKNGAIIQLSAASILGQNGRKAKRAAFQFIEHGLAHVIALGVTAQTFNTYGLQLAYDVLSKRYGSRTVYTLKENAESIIRGEALNKERPERIKQTKFLGIF